MKTAIGSKKGGTGKSWLTTVLAVTAPEPVHVVDLDPQGGQAMNFDADPYGTEPQDVCDGVTLYTYAAYESGAVAALMKNKKAHVLFDLPPRGDAEHDYAYKHAQRFVCVIQPELNHLTTAQHFIGDIPKRKPWAYVVTNASQRKTYGKQLPAILSAQHQTFSIGTDAKLQHAIDAKDWRRLTKAASKHDISGLQGFIYG